MILVDKVAVITGPAKGMGAAISLTLAREGADLVMVGRDTAAIAEFAPQIEALGRRAVIVKGDVTSPTDMAAMAETAAEAFDGRIDILVNVAGVRGPVEIPTWEIEPDEFDDVLDVNLRGTFLPIRALMPLMIERRYGKIVNIGGTHGMRGKQFRAAYSTSKWGLRGLTRSLALEAGAHNINVNCVCPGVVTGDRFERTMADRTRILGITREQALAEIYKDIALRRLVTAEDVAASVLFLVSESSRNITGQEIVVDGGFVI